MEQLYDMIVDHMTSLVIQMDVLAVMMTVILSFWRVCIPQSNLIGCIYRIGTPTTARKYDEALLENLLWASETKHLQKVIVGDFNMPNVSWSPGPTIVHTNPGMEDNEQRVKRKGM